VGSDRPTPHLLLGRVVLLSPHIGRGCIVLGLQITPQGLSLPLCAHLGSRLGPSSPCFTAPGDLALGFGSISGWLWRTVTRQSDLTWGPSKVSAWRVRATRGGVGPRPARGSWVYLGKGHGPGRVLRNRDPGVGCRSWGIHGSGWSPGILGKGHFTGSTL
jgi:hypothetical protein